jgi:TfoX/Sxy family transcriptional regulator of competence genes
VAYDTELADRVRERLAKETRVSEREMFGGLGFMWAGNMICGVQRDELMVRVGPDLYHDALTRPHAREMEFTGRPMKGFVTVGRDGLADEAELDLWVRLGLAHAKTFPAKGAKKAARKKKAAPAKKAAKKAAKKSTKKRG